MALSIIFLGTLSRACSTKREYILIETNANGKVAAKLPNAVLNKNLFTGINININIKKGDAKVFYSTSRLFLFC